MQLLGTIGHNQPPSASLAERFKATIEKMKTIGLKGEVAVTASLVMFSTSDKWSAQQCRKALKAITARSANISTETRPKKGFYVFTIICKD